MNPVLVVRKVTRAAPGAPQPLDSDNPEHWVPNGRACWVWCPGCDDAHRMAVLGEDGTQPDGPTWTWDGNETAPTFDPSIMVKGNGVCHSYIKAGRWEFLGDCTHQLAGQTVDMVPVPDWMAG